MEKIISVSLNEYGELEVIRRYSSNSMYMSFPPKPVPDRIVKEIYKACEDAMIRLMETKEGKYMPSYTVPEKIEFD